MPSCSSSHVRGQTIYRESAIREYHARYFVKAQGIALVGAHLQIVLRHYDVTGFLPGFRFLVLAFGII